MLRCFMRYRLNLRLAMGSLKDHQCSFNAIRPFQEGLDALQWALMSECQPSDLIATILETCRPSFQFSLISIAVNGNDRRCPAWSA